MDDFTNHHRIACATDKSFRNDRDCLREGSPLHEGDVPHNAPISRYRVLPDRFPIFAGWVPSHSFLSKICSLCHHARWSTKRAHKRSPVFGVHGLKRPPLAGSMVSFSSSFLSSWLGPSEKMWHYRSGLSRTLIESCVSFIWNAALYDKSL